MQLSMHAIVFFLKARSYSQSRNQLIFSGVHIDCNLFFRV